MLIKEANIDCLQRSIFGISRDPYAWLKEGNMRWKTLQNHRDLDQLSSVTCIMSTGPLKPVVHELVVDYFDELVLLK